MDLVKRAEAAQLTVNRYLDQPFAWGANDCAHLVGFAVQRLGHRNPLKGVGKYTSLTGAVRALRKLGIERLEDRLDTLFERIGYASAVAGDILSLKGATDGLTGLGLHLGDDRVLGFFMVEGEANAIGRVATASAIADQAWRVTDV